MPAVLLFPLEHLGSRSGGEERKVKGWQSPVCHSSIFLLPQARRQMGWQQLLPVIHKAPLSTTFCLGPEGRAPSREPRPSCPTHSGLLSFHCITLFFLLPHPLLSSLLPLDSRPTLVKPLSLSFCVSLSQKIVRLGRALYHQVQLFHSSGEEGSSARGRSPEGKLHRRLWQGPGHGSTLPLVA